MQVLDCSWLWGADKDCDLKLILRTHASLAAATQLHEVASRDAQTETHSNVPRSSSGSPPSYQYTFSTVPPEASAFYYNDHDESYPYTSQTQLPLDFHYRRPMTLAEFHFGEQLDADCISAGSDSSGSGDVLEQDLALSTRPWPALRMTELPDGTAAQQMLLEQEYHLHAVIIASASAYFKLLVTDAVGTVERTVSAQPMPHGGVPSSSCQGAPHDGFKYSLVVQVESGQFLAATAVLAFIYMHKLPQKSTLTVKHLLDMILVSWGIRTRQWEIA